MKRTRSILPLLLAALLCCSCGTARHEVRADSPQRAVALQGVMNARTLDGLRMEDGRTIRSGKLLRSGNLSRLRLRISGSSASWPPWWISAPMPSVP